MNKNFSVSDVLKESFNFIVNKPVILLPMFIALLIGQLIDRLAFSSIDIPDTTATIDNLNNFMTLLFVVIFMSYIILAFTEGMYPKIVKNMIEKKEIDFITTFKHVVQHVLPLITAGILVGILVFIGTLFFIIPGLIFIIWYFYTVPVIMFENLGALDGMKASKSFASNKKFETFQVFIVPLLIFLLISVLRARVFVSIPIASEIIHLIFCSIVWTWMSIIPAFIYLKKEEKAK